MYSDLANSGHATCVAKHGASHRWHTLPPAMSLAGAMGVTHTFTHRLYEDFSSQFLGKKGNLHSEVAKAALRARFVRATKTPRPFARCVARATVMAKLLRSWDDQQLMFIESPRPWDVSQTLLVPVP